MRTFILVFGLILLCQSSRSQSIIFHFADDTQTSYSLSVIKNISFSETITYLNFLDGFSTIWNLEYVVSYSFENIPNIGTSIDTRSISASPRVYPNPSSESVMIEYSLNRASKVDVCIVDVHGRLIERLVDSTQPAGIHSVVWAGKVSEGIYAVQIRTGDTVRSSKIIIQ